MTMHAQRTLIQQPSIGNWGKAATTGIGVVNGYGTATGGTALASPPAGYSGMSFNSSSTLTITAAGLFDVLIISGGGGGGEGTGYNGEGGGGGSAAQLIIQTIYLAVGTLTVTVGAGGAQGLGGLIFGGISGLYTLGSTNYYLLESSPGVVGGQSWGGGTRGFNGGGASYRGGYGGNPSVAGFGLGGYAGGASSGGGASGNGGGGGTGGAGSQGGAGAGTALSFSGVSVTYGQGGLPASATNGATNTGSGGGGATGANTGNSGGSGVVVVRFKV